MINLHKTEPKKLVYLHKISLEIEKSIDIYAKRIIIENVKRTKTLFYCYEYGTRSIFGQYGK